MQLVYQPVCLFISNSIISPFFKSITTYFVAVFSPLSARTAGTHVCGATLGPGVLLNASFPARRVTFVTPECCYGVTLFLLYNIDKWLWKHAVVQASVFVSIFLPPSLFPRISGRKMVSRLEAILYLIVICINQSLFIDRIEAFYNMWFEWCEAEYK